MMENPSLEKQPLLSPIMRWFMLAMVLANIAGQMPPMFISIYLAQLGASIAQVGLVFTLISLASLGLQIMGGWISDSIGRLRAIAIGSVAGILGFIALLLAPTWQWMLAALIVYQIPFALVGPSFGAFIAENSTEENRGRVYGITSSIYQITGVIGPALGGFLMNVYGFKGMLLLAMILYTIACGLRVWMATTMRSTDEKASAPLTMASFKSSMMSMFGMLFAGGVITWILISDGISDIAFRLTENLQPLYLQNIAGLSIQQIGLLGSIFAVAMMISPLFSGKLADQHGERLPIAGGFVLIFVGLNVFLQAKAFPLFGLSWIIFGIGVGLLEPAYRSLISKVVPSHLLGTFSGVFFSSIGFISLPAPWIGGQLWEKFGPRMPFVITTIASIAVVPIIWFKFKAPAPEPETTGVNA
jgi:MFS family permease